MLEHFGAHDEITARTAHRKLQHASKHVHGTGEILGEVQAVVPAPTRKNDPTQGLLATTHVDHAEVRFDPGGNLFTKETPNMADDEVVATGKAHSI
jgi:hypothetical protein